jgi:spore coat protein U-like protein
MKKFLALTVLVAAASVAAVAPAMAETKEGKFDVTATVPSACTSPSANTVSLGSYDGVTAVAPASTDVKYKCTNGTKATLTLSSNNNSNSTTKGKLIDPSTDTPINYDFDNGISSGTGSGLASATDNSVTTNITVPLNQTPKAGTGYKDTIKAVLSY